MSVSRQISAGVILVDRSGGVLLQLRDDNPAIMYPNHWGITGGAGHPGESPEQVARREIAEETGLELGRIEPFRAYYFVESAPSAGSKRTATRSRADYELYLYHAPCETPLDEMTCGEGQALRFFGPDDVRGIDIAYNHRDVLTDFFASGTYARYLSGEPFDGEQPRIEPLDRFLADLDEGTPWFDAMMRAIAVWERPEEKADGRSYRYLVGGEALDWLLLAERLLEVAGSRVDDAGRERLLFEARVPDASAADTTGRLTDDGLRDHIGEPKHRAHLNYVYGVTVEEALQYAAELELSKERVSVNIKDRRAEDTPDDPIFDRIYGRSRADLLREYRDEMMRPHTSHISLTELREFMYWLFKYRVKNQEPARVASDTRKALAQLSAMEAAVRRSGRLRPEPAPEPDVILEPAG